MDMVLQGLAEESGPPHVLFQDDGGHPEVDSTTSFLSRQKTNNRASRWMTMMDKIALLVPVLLTTVAAQDLPDDCYHDVRRLVFPCLSEMDNKGSSLSDTRWSESASVCARKTKVDARSCGTRFLPTKSRCRWGALPCVGGRHTGPTARDWR